MNDYLMSNMQLFAKMVANESGHLYRDAWKLSRPPKIYLHWSAGRYNTNYDDYQISIDGEGQICYNVDSLRDYRPATYKRNTGAISLCLNCAYGATSSNIGQYPPTTIQIETISAFCMVAIEILKLDYTKQHILTHGEAGDNEDGLNTHEQYGSHTTCERWDLEYLGNDESPIFQKNIESPKRGGNIIRGKAIWYSNHYGQLF